MKRHLQRRQACFSDRTRTVALDVDIRDSFDYPVYHSTLDYLDLPIAAPQVRENVAFYIAALNRLLDKEAAQDI